MNLRLLERILRRAGYEEILGTSQPEGVMELLDTWQPDIVLLDLHMPGLNGFEVLQQIRERTTSPAAYLPVLVLTADILPETKLRALEQGASDRKSTRLNSSHVKPSYAVFCLKKKNTSN